MRLRRRFREAVACGGTGRGVVQMLWDKHFPLENPLRGAPAVHQGGRCSAEVECAVTSSPDAQASTVQQSKNNDNYQRSRGPACQRKHPPEGHLVVPPQQQNSTGVVTRRTCPQPPLTSTLILSLLPHLIDRCQIRLSAMRLRDRHRPLLARKSKRTASRTAAAPAYGWILVAAACLLADPGQAHDSSFSKDQRQF